MTITYPVLISGKKRHRIFILFLLLILISLSLIVLHIQFTTSSGINKMRLEMYKSTLYSTIEQYNILPYMLSMDNIVKQSMDADSPVTEEVLNKRVEYFNNHLKTAAIFILDASGKAIASSNWKEKGSYVGQNYSYRPYYKQAMAGQSGKFYGIGSTTRTPGFFLSIGIKKADKIVGVVVVKISLNEIEKAWSEGPEDIIVADENSIIFLSAKSQWRMKYLDPLPEKTKEKLQFTRQYSQDSLNPAEYHPCFTYKKYIFLNNTKGKLCWFPEYYAQHISFPDFNWKMMIFVPLDGMYWTFIITLTISIVVCLLAFTFLKYWRMRLHTQQLLRQANVTLEQQVRQRTQELESSNKKLVLEMQERSQAEQVLQLTRSELAESSKLAALGQMATEIAHEQNQPLAAIHALTDNTRIMLEKKMYSQVDQNLKYIISVIERMTQLISELKTFASRHRVPKGSADIIKVIYSAVSLLNHSLEKHHIERRIKAPSMPLYVGCDELGLEQIFSNLITNALDAMEGSPYRRLDIAVSKSAGHVFVTIKDSGPGFSGDDISHIFEPFFTTKRRGTGLGLAIVSEIVRNSNGTIMASNHPEGGAIITVNWPEWREDNA